MFENKGLKHKKYFYYIKSTKQKLPSEETDFERKFACIKKSFRYNEIR